jgi:hypothetical protein
MVIRVQPERHRVSNARNCMRRLEHLAGVVRVVIRIVTLHPHRDPMQHLGDSVLVELRREFRELFESGRKGGECLPQQFEFGLIDHARPWLVVAAQLTVSLLTALLLPAGSASVDSGLAEDWH